METLEVVKGIRGAITVPENSPEAIERQTKKLLAEIMSKNSLQKEKIISIFFTATPDLNAQFPATAARKAGLTEIPLLCAQEMDVPGSLEKVIRVLILTYLPENQKVQHLYLEGAKVLRPDW
ncbi:MULTISPECIES: chorismate mutase [Carboxydothermus]|uniref:chorismate mutase n=1 Tax=Carboxydothermus hydrogenoformans (strain ATCC BAA-161 / DSM 6008 / Z-2901) TaxID=246194 RepID=Q3AEV3_CARHZ|nr:chorismate mutase [Carboxydothermus hydrogenoformans Z-2901]